MRSSCHLSSSTLSTGTLATVRVNPTLRRRIASSRPSRCGMDTIRGEGIFGDSLSDGVYLVPEGGEKRVPRLHGRTELSGFPPVSPADGRAKVPTAGLEETPNVYRNNHPDHSRDRLARRLQRHRRRPVLWHRLLWRRRPRACYRDSRDPAAARKALRRTRTYDYSSFRGGAKHRTRNDR